MPKIELYALVTRAQEYISRNYATVLADKNRRQELENCIGKYLYDTAYTVELHPQLSEQHYADLRTEARSYPAQEL